MGSCMGSNCQSPYLEGNTQFSYTLRQKQFNEILQAYKFNPPKQHCSSGSEITSICINPKCKKHTLFCSKEACQSCYADHKTCESIWLASVVQFFEAKSRQDNRFISEIFNHERQLFSRIEQQRNNFLKNNCQSMIQRQYLNAFKSIVSCTNDQPINKKDIAGVIDNLKASHRQNQNLNWQLLSAYKSQMDKLLIEIKSIQEQILGSFVHKQTQFQLPENPHNSYFEIENSLSKAVVTFNEQDNHWYNFIKKKKIPQNTVSTFYVKQIKTTDLSVLIGVGTSAIVGKSDCAYQCKDVILYVCGDGFVCERGKERPGGRPVKDAEVVHITVDTKTWRILWSIGNQLLASAVLEPWKGKDFFLVVMMYDKGDKVEVGQI